MYYIIVGAIGALIAISVSAISRSNFYILSALVPFFPFFSLLAYVMAHRRGDGDGLGRVIQFNMISMLPFVAFAASMYCLHASIGFYTAIAVSIGVWFATAFLTYVLYNHYV